MAKGNHSAYQQGNIKRYFEHKDTILLNRLSEIVSDLYLAQGKQATKLWDSARAALMRLAAQDPRVPPVLRERSVEKLAKLVSELNAGAAPPESPESPESPEQAPAEESAGAEPAKGEVQAAADSGRVGGEFLTPEQLKSAMKAFRKRLKLTRLDDESRLARSPMSSGKKSEIAAIMPPREFPQVVWDELVQQGKLKPVGRGFYELAEA